MYKNLVNQMPVLNPENWAHKSPRFGEEEVKSLCDAVHLNKQDTDFGFIKRQVMEEAVLKSLTSC